MTQRRLYLLHVFALTGFALAQPIFDLLADNGDFFIARGSHTLDLLVLVLVLIFGLPLIVAGIYKIISKISDRGLQISHAIVLAILMTSIFLPVLKKTGLADSIVILTAAAIGLLFSLAYRRFHGLRVFISALSPLVLVFAGLFFLGSAAKELDPPTEPANQVIPTLHSSNTPVVMLIFDEFALTALMDAERNIDKRVFPNFYRLSQSASWYRNATTVATSTMLSVPAILSGNYPREFVSQTYQNYPNTLFTLLADSHQMNVYESTTTMCSPGLCSESLKQTRSSATRIKFLLADVSAVFLHIIAPDSVRSRLPVINMTWENYWQLSEAASWHRHNYGGRLEQLQYFIDSITPSEPPGLHLVHTNFPHLPYQYLPSGSRYQGEWEIPGLDFSTDHWGDNLWLIKQAYQRFMLQAAAADQFIGKLMDHLQSIGIFDDALIIVVADHGVSFNPDSQRRDAPPFINLERDVLPVPLFIKYPHQNTGQVSDENVETIDILPTIADVLGSGPELNMDGRSLLSEQQPRAQKLAFHSYRDFLAFKTGAGGQAKYDTLKWKLKNFNPASGIEGLYKIGNYPELLGLPVTDFPVIETADLDIRLDKTGLYADVNPNSGFIPSRVTGSIRLDGLDSAASVVVIVNDMVQAVTEMYSAGKNIYKFSAMVPEKAFIRGKNSVTALLLSADPDGNAEFLGGKGQVDSMSSEPEMSLWTLENDFIKTPDGEIPVIRDRLKGHLEYARAEDGIVEFFGWAMDVSRLERVDKLVIFEDGVYRYSGVTGMPRGEAATFGAAAVILVGFQLIVPKNLFHSLGDSEIRLFAISKYGDATELGYFENYEWSDRRR